MKQGLIYSHLKLISSFIRNKMSSSFRIKDTMKRRKNRTSPEHLQRVGLVDLDATSGTVVALLKVLHDAALTDCRGNKAGVKRTVSVSTGSSLFRHSGSFSFKSSETTR